MALGIPLIVLVLFGLYRLKLIPVVALVGLMIFYGLSIPVIGSIDTRIDEGEAMRARQAARVAASKAKIITLKKNVQLQPAISEIPRYVEVSVKALSTYQPFEEEDYLSFSDKGRALMVKVSLFDPESQYWSETGYKGPVSPSKTEKINGTLVETFYISRVPAHFKTVQYGLRTKSVRVDEVPAKHMVGVTIPVQSVGLFKAHCLGSTTNPAVLAELRAICVSLTARALPAESAVP